MISLILMLALSGSCERVEGSAQCVEVTRVTETRYKCVGSCYLKDNKDGGYTPRRIRADHQPSQDACVAELDRQARNGCQP